MEGGGGEVEGRKEKGGEVGRGAPEKDEEEENPQVKKGVEGVETVKAGKPPEKFTGSLQNRLEGPLLFGGGDQPRAVRQGEERGQKEKGREEKKEGEHWGEGGVGEECLPQGPDQVEGEGEEEGAGKHHQKEDDEKVLEESARGQVEAEEGVGEAAEDELGGEEEEDKEEEE